MTDALFTALESLKADLKADIAKLPPPLPLQTVTRKIAAQSLDDATRFVCSAIELVAFAEKTVREEDPDVRKLNALYGVDHALNKTLDVIKQARRVLNKGEFFNEDKMSKQ